MAIVLAGRRNDGRLRTVSDAAWEALIDVAGRPMAERVVRAVTEAVGPTVVVVGPRDLEPHLPPGVEVLPPGATLLDNLDRGLRVFPAEEPVLVVTGDAALLRPEHVTDFWNRVRETPADIWYSIVPRSVVETVLPGVRRTYVRLREGAFTGGNLLALRPAVWAQVERLAAQVVDLRKAPWRMATLVGIPFLLRFLFGRVGLREAEEVFSRLGGICGRAVILPYAEVGIDVDKPSDHAFCERFLAIRGGA